ncbi:MAG: type IV pili methyl-accepting chemotaxis transducer N-terminal domain-containing protein [Pseudomonadota bacterium]
MRRGWIEGYFGKYREIVLAVAFFLIFDLAVLVLNFLISFQIAEDATAVNLAGRQRMLSQRMTKALLLARQDVTAEGTAAASLDELAKTVQLFDTTLDGFRRGGTVSGGDGRPVRLDAVRTAQGVAILDEAAAIWRGYRERLEPLLGEAFTDAQLTAAVDAARAGNLRLLGLMNDLTTHLEESASSKAQRLRAVQTAGILLALLNFAFILQKFIRRLRDTDRRIEAAQRETAEILGTVKEGLFLLDRELRIGLLFSKSLPQILGHDVRPGMDFRAVLVALVPAAALRSAYDYIDLLLQDRVKESLVTELNPLARVEVRGADAGRKRVLSLQFNRAFVDGRISHLLVTVADVSAQAELEAQVADARSRARGEVEALLDLLQIDGATLADFLQATERKLLQVNDHLRSAGGSGDHRRAIAAVLRLVHSIKGDAAALRLSMFEDLAQQFEAQLIQLRDKGPVSGDDLIALPLPLDELFQRITLVRTLAQRVAAYQQTLAPAATDTAALADALEQLAQRIARDHGKQAKLVAELDALPSLPEPVQRELRDIAVQLLRNAVVHGIEPADERSRCAKAPTGIVYVGLKPLGDGQFDFVVRDDGRGLSVRRVRDALVRSGRYSEAQLDELSERQILMKLFESGVSTAEQVTRDAGHGIGLDLVLQKVQQLHARLRVSSQENGYTQFSLRFAP